MRRKLTTLLIIAAASLTVWAQSLALQQVKATGDVAVVVNSKNSTDDLSLSDLRRILSGERKFWSNRTPVTLVLRSEGARERAVVLSAVLRMNDNMFKDYWLGKVFRGEASGEPLSVPSSGLATEYVAGSPGAVTFIAGKDVRSDVKVLKIDGKLPGDAGYPLK